MDLNQTWTQFAVESEVEYRGAKRIVESHNKLQAEVEQLKKQNNELSVLLMQWIEEADTRRAVDVDWDLVEVSKLAVEESKCHA